jgi:hypothetical protein
MFCPKCSQSQASEDMRFCSRCGFPLIGVAELVANDGTLELKDPDGSDITRRKIIVRGWAVLTVLNLILAPFFVIGVQSVEAVVIYLFFSLVLLLGGFAWMIYTRPSREDRDLFNKTNRDKDIRAGDTQSALPPNRSISVDPFILRHQTNELGTPQSITEGTTKLLEKS